MNDVTRGAESPELPTGTVAFLFTDVEGSTELLRLLGDDYAAVIDEHRALLLGAFEAHDGRVVDSQGESFFVAFSRVKDAAAAAALAQRGFALTRGRRTSTFGFAWGCTQASRSSRTSATSVWESIEPPASAPLRTEARCSCPRPPPRCSPTTSLRT